MKRTKTLLDESIRKLHEVFQRYDRIALSPAEPVCEQDRAKLNAVRLHLISVPFEHLAPKDLLDYYYLAVQHLGDADDLRHFLPKIIDGIATNEGRSILAPAHLPALLQSADIGDWPAEERQSVARFAVAAEASGIITASIAREIAELTRANDCS